MAEPTLQSPSVPEPLPAPPVAAHEMTDAERTTWMRDGKMPEREAEDGASATPEPAEQAASTDVNEEAVSETAAPGTKGKKSKSKGADARVQELLADRARERDSRERAERLADDLRARLDRLEQSAKPDAKTVPSTPADAKAAAAKAYERFSNHPDAPDPESFTDLKQWGAAMAHFVAEKTAEEKFASMMEQHTSKQAEAAEVERGLLTVVEACEKRIAVETAADPTLEKRVDERFKRITPSSLLQPGEAEQPKHFIKEQVINAEHPLKLSVYFSTEEGQAKFRELSEMSPARIIREVALLDARFTQGSTASAGAPAKTFTKAPAPPTNLGGRPSSGGDAAEAAVKAGDFDGFMAAMDAREGVTSRR